MKITEKVIAKNYIINLSRKNSNITQEDIIFAVRSFNKYRTIEAFMIRFVSMHKVPYNDIPNEFVKSKSFLIAITLEDNTRLNELYEVLNITNFYTIIEAMPSMSALLSARNIKANVKNEIKRYLKAKQKAQATDKKAKVNVTI